jgi:hypothetical protein
MTETAVFFGGFIRWLLKGCKTKLGDEVHNRFEGTTFLKDYGLENYILGVFSSFVLICLLIWIIF